MYNTAGIVTIMLYFPICHLLRGGFQILETSDSRQQKAHRANTWRLRMISATRDQVYHEESHRLVPMIWFLYSPSVVLISEYPIFSVSCPETIGPRSRPAVHLKRLINMAWEYVSAPAFPGWCASISQTASVRK